MPLPAPDPVPLAVRVLLVAGGIAATALVGLGLIRIDELSGTAHLRAPAPEMVWASAPRDPYAASRAISFDTPASAIGRPPPTPADNGYVIRSILPIKGAIAYGQWVWDESGAPPGPLVVTVDLDARVLSVFRGGHEIGATAVLLGTQEKPTPLGMFPITQKDAHHVSTLYDAPMPYMLRLTPDGVSIHATRVRNGYASHGCIGVPMDFARILFKRAHLRDRVYITRGKRVGLGDRLDGGP